MADRLKGSSDRSSSTGAGATTAARANTSTASRHAAPLTLPPNNLQKEREKWERRQGNTGNLPKDGMDSSHIEVKTCDVSKFTIPGQYYFKMRILNVKLILKATIFKIAWRAAAIIITA